jgi:Spy/CpxP family protein refolding chaperone
MKRSAWSTAIYLLVVFASGTIVGAFAHRLYMVQSVQSVREAAETARNPQEYRKRYLGEMRVRLNLTAEQEAALNEILDDTRIRYRELHERFRPEMKSIQNEQTDKINAILNPAQQAQYEKMREEREQRRKKDRDRTKYGL